MAPTLTNPKKTGTKIGGTTCQNPNDGASIRGAVLDVTPGHHAWTGLAPSTA